MFRFSIRDILWLTLVVALGLVWYGQFRLHSSDAAILREQLATQEKNTEKWRRAVETREVAVERFIRDLAEAQLAQNEAIRARMKTEINESQRIIKAIQDERQRSRPKTYYLWPF